MDENRRVYAVQVKHFSTVESTQCDELVSFLLVTHSTGLIGHDIMLLILEKYVKITQTHEIYHAHGFKVFGECHTETTIANAYIDGKPVGKRRLEITIMTINHTDI